MGPSYISRVMVGTSFSIFSSSSSSSAASSSSVSSPSDSEV